MLITVTVAFVQPFILLCPDRPGSFCILENKYTRVPKSSCVLKHSSFYVRDTTAASALLAICFCIDSLLKRCWFSPCRVCMHVCVEGEQERQRIFALNLCCIISFLWAAQAWQSVSKTSQDTDIRDGVREDFSLGDDLGGVKHRPWHAIRMQWAQIPSDPSSPGEMFSNRTNSKKKPYLVYLSLHLFLHLLSLFMWRIKVIYSPGCVCAP